MTRNALVILATITLLSLGVRFVQAQPTDSNPPPSGDQANLPPPPPDEGSMHGQGPMRGGAPPPAQLSPQQIEQVIDVMRDMSPWLAEKLQEARKDNPQRVEAIIQHAYPRYRQFLELKRHDPELYELRVKEIKLDMQSRKLAWRLRQVTSPAPGSGSESSPPDKVDSPPAAADPVQTDSSTIPADAAEAEPLRQQLHDVLGQLFDLHRESRRHEIEMLKRRIDELEASLDDSHDKRETLIDQRMSELLEQAGRGPRWWQRGEDRLRGGDGPRGQAGPPWNRPPAPGNGPESDAAPHVNAAPSPSQNSRADTASTPTDDRPE